MSRPTICCLLLSITLLLAACGGAPSQPDVSSAPTDENVTSQDWPIQIQTFDGVDMMLVQAGCFMMGSDAGDDDERPVHEQCFPTPFWIDRYEVTNAQFMAKGGRAELPSHWTEPNRPRTNVRWFEARDFCVLRGGRLPTEAEWEYAARSPNNYTYPWGNEFALDYGVFAISSNGQTGEVGSVQVADSWVGALDMSGNVWEWTSTIYDPVRFPYPYNPADGREDPNDNTSMRVMRGGSWYEADEYYGRSANRARSGPSIQDFNIGFRCVRDYSS
jgi:sulfatase modifying factor 1